MEISGALNHDAKHNSGLLISMSTLLSFFMVIDARFRAMQISCGHTALSIMIEKYIFGPHHMHHRTLLSIVSKRILSRHADLWRPQILLHHEMGVHFVTPSPDFASNCVFLDFSA